MQPTALLASDMDGTVIPLDSKPEREKEISRFQEIITANPQVALAYVTGRHLELGLDGIARHNLPTPHIFVCDVGTTIYFRTDQSQWQRDEEYRTELKKSWHNRTGADIAAMLADLAMLIPQEEEKQKEFKQSYYLEPAHDHETVLAAIHTCLADHELTANVIFSIDSLKNIGLIDVLPEIAAKDYALAYLCRKLELDRNRIVYAGDSGNDLLAFLSGFNAIIVNNTAEPVKEAVRREARTKQIEEHIFFAPTPFVQGVMDGCAHFNLFRKD